jgi:2-dehydropantoate 2-reductase
MALRRFQRVYAMLVHMPAQHIEPGRVQSHTVLKRGVLDLGRYPTGSDELAVTIRRHLERANFISCVNARVLRLKYAKLLANLNNAVSATLPKGEDANAISETLRTEGRACLKAACIDWANESELKARRDQEFAIGSIDGVERQGGSSRQSLIRGTGDIEADFLNGEICLLGRLHGVPTPANAVLQRLANELAQSHGAPGSLDAEDVRRLVDAEAQLTV